MNFKKFIKLISSYTFGIELERFKSHISNELIVYYIKGKYHLNTIHANYSYGELHHAFKKVLKKIKINKYPVKKCLLLGFGCGSVVSILQEELKMKCKITAIENDPVVIEIGKKYFNTEQFSNLEVVIDDAYHFVKKTNQHFDLIVFDIYIDNKIPFVFETEDFIKGLKNIMLPKGILVFNKDVHAEEMKISFEELKVTFKRYFPDYKTVKASAKSIFFVSGTK